MVLDLYDVIILFSNTVFKIADDLMIQIQLLTTYYWAHNYFAVLELEGSAESHNKFDEKEEGEEDNMVTEDGIVILPDCCCVVCHK